MGLTYKIVTNFIKTYNIVKNGAANLTNIEGWSIMKVYNIKDLEKQNKKRRLIAIKAARKVDPDFVIGKRKFDVPRKTKGKQEILDRLEKEEHELLH